jgi:ABC-type sugar transport system ATPase subunit
LKVTTLYVTHDQVEALTLGDRVVVLRDGNVEQVATPEVLYARPATTFVAGFVGSPPMNLVAARVEGDRARLGQLAVPLPAAVVAHLRATGTAEITLGVRPEAISASPPPEVVATIVVDPGTAEIIGGDTLVQGAVGSTRITARVPTGAVPKQLWVGAEALHFFGPDGQRLGRGATGDG